MLSLLIILSFNVYAEDTLDPNSKIVKQAISAFMEKNNIPGVAVELYVDGIPHSYYFGYANEEKKTLVSQKTIFEIGSISKVMTSLLLAEEIDWSKMQLNDSITKYIEDLPPSFEKISLKNLATHTAGLAANIPTAIKTEDDLNTYLTKITLLHTPNKQWLYSNIGIGLLGEAIVKLSNKDINKLYVKQILSPLGMQPIGTLVPKKLQANYAQGYDAEGKPAPALNFDLLSAAASVKASANDMQRFLRAAIGLPGTPEKIFYPMRLTQTAYVALPGQLQGLGWHIHPITTNNMRALLNVNALEQGPVKVGEMIEKPTYDGNALIDKTGTTAGFRAYIALIPNKKSGIVILTNRYATDKAIISAGREILFKLMQGAKA